MASRPIRNLFVACLAFILAAISLRADLAPVEYVGFGISPVKTEGLRMLSAQVDITWGNPCKLNAVFIIDNQTAKPADIQLGFPIQKVYSSSLNGYVPDELTFAFNDIPVQPASIAINDPITRKLLSIKVPNIDYGNRDLMASIQFISDKSKELDPEHKGVKFVLRKASDGSVSEAGLTMSGGMGNGRLADVLAVMVWDLHLEYSIEGDTVYLQPSSHWRQSLELTDYTWYRCQHTFPPGSTKVSVTTQFPASLTKMGAYHERILYCIETGGSWGGTIGSEEVDIHFPHPIVPGQIFNADPNHYTVDGNIVRWFFKDFKPKGRDHDIEIEYLRPDVVAAIAQNRAEFARDPSNPVLILKLAKDLFALGSYKGYDPYPPTHITLKDLNDILSRIKNDSDRALFKSFYSLNDKDKNQYIMSYDSEEKNNDKILRLMKSINYQYPDFGSSEVIEAQVLIEKLLQDHPDNAEAWKVYFANYYRFHYSGRMRPIESGKYGPDEVEQMKKAVSLCPSDTCLRLWLKVATAPRQDPPDLAQGKAVAALREQIEKQGFLDNDFDHIKYVGY